MQLASQETVPDDATRSRGGQGLPRSGAPRAGSEGSRRFMRPLPGTRHCRPSSRTQVRSRQTPGVTNAEHRVNERRERRMKRIPLKSSLQRVLRLRGFALAFGALAPRGACATPSRRFEFGVIGDAPYVLAEEAKVAAAIAEMNRSDLALVVHGGDMQADPRVPFSGGTPTGSDESLQRRMELFGASQHPFSLTPGDNDGTDCHLDACPLIAPDCPRRRANQNLVRLQSPSPQP